MKTELSAGSTIETRCTRCNGVLNHSIVAMVGEKIVRVECSTCKGVHNYHPAKVLKVKESATAKGGRVKAGTPRNTKLDPEAAARAEWVEMQPGMDPEQAIPYEMSRIYRVKNLLSHPNFGLGIVQSVLPPNKMDVLFKAGKKRLRCG